MAIRFLDEEPLVAATPKAVTPSKIRFIDPEPITEEQRTDLAEEQARPTAMEFAMGVGSGAKRELGQLKKIATQVLPEAARTIVNDYQVSKFGTSEEKKQLKEKRAKQIISASKQSPEIAKEALLDIGRTFGADPERGFDVDVAIQKWQEAPIESALDAVGLASVLKVGGKTLFKSTAKAIGKNKKKLAQNIIGKNDVETKQILQNASNTEVNTVLDDLYEESPIIKKLDVSSQLDNPNYSEEIGKNAVEKINRLKKRDQIKLNEAIKKVKDQKIDNTTLNDDIAQTLSDKGFLKEGNILDVDNIEPGLSKSALTNEIKRLNDPKPLTVGEIKLRMDSLDNKINWKNPKVADEGLIEVRRAYRQQIRNISGDYDENALRIAEKLDKFEPQLKRFEKVGAGEKFGKSLFQTKSELDEFINLMSKTPDKLGGQINGDLKTLKAWHAWNKYFKQNPDFIIGEIPGISKGLIPAIKKRGIKADINLGSPRPKLPGKKTAIGTRAGLEINSGE